jgi:hypothetical protein
MIRGRERTAYRLIQTLYDQGTVGGLTDRELLSRFADHQGEAAESAFAALIERHGLIVLRFCRSPLRDEHDAFQATTYNELEQFFGSYRYHERRASGRKVACPGTVVRGSVRLVASAATRLRPVGPEDLVPSDLQAWCDLRGSLERRQAVRTLGRRFRRDPVAYLQSLEESLIKQALPP